MAKVLLLKRKKPLRPTRLVAKIVVLFRESGLDDEAISQAIGRAASSYDLSDENLLAKLAFGSLDAVPINGTVVCCRCRRRISTIPCVGCRCDGVQPPFWNYQPQQNCSRNDAQERLPMVYRAPHLRRDHIARAM
jgi:hypothetical protein